LIFDTGRAHPRSILLGRANGDLIQRSFGGGTTWRACRDSQRHALAVCRGACAGAKLDLAFVEVFLELLPVLLGHGAVLIVRTQLTPAGEEVLVVAELGNCDRPYGTPCQHEHACIRCPMLRINPAMLPRLSELDTDLSERRSRASQEGWLGEIEGIDLTLRLLREKQATATKLRTTGSVVDLGMPTLSAPTKGRPSARLSPLTESMRRRGSRSADPPATTGAVRALLIQVPLNSSERLS
jgi:hypothetical protein